MYQVGLDESTVCGQIARRYLGTIVAGGTGIDAAYAAKTTIASNLAANNAPAPGTTCAKAGHISMYTGFCGINMDSGIFNTLFLIVHEKFKYL